MTAVANKEQADRRCVARRRVLKGGLVAFSERHATLSCTVRDLSDAGARLRLGGAPNVPDRFELIIDLDGLEALCQVVWRKDQEMGVKFLSNPRKVPPRRKQVITPVVGSGPPAIRRKPSFVTPVGAGCAG